MRYMSCLTWYTSYAEFNMKSGGVIYFNKYCGKMHCETANKGQNNL